LLELEDGRYLAESNAILHFLAEGTPLLPTDRFLRAKALEWCFFEQYSHEPYVATARYIVKHFPPDSPRHAELPMRREKGHAALKVMEGHLATREYFATGRYTLADIALYAYTHVSHEGGIELHDYPHIRAWMARVAAQPGYVPLERRPPEKAR
jgi:glutathione S-transferase